MKTLRIVLIVLGALVGALLAVWLVYMRRIPTVRVSYTLGKGYDVSLDWIRLQ